MIEKDEMAQMFDGHKHLIELAWKIADELERLRRLEKAVVGSWMEACDRGSPWHKELRYPCVELGYLTLENNYFELAEEYQDMAKEWIKEQYGEEEE